VTPLKSSLQSQPVILLGADDPGQRGQLVDALQSNRLAHCLKVVESDQALLEYLEATAKHPHEGSSPFPSLIIVGFSKHSRIGNAGALKFVKNSSALRFIPVLVAVSSGRTMDTLEAYALGACSVIPVPIRFDAMVRVMQVMEDYWFHTVRLPPRA
jgi:CheY-like chemotaxis protein